MHKLLAENSGHGSGHESELDVLIQQITVPDVEQEMRDVQAIACLDFAVDSEDSHGMAVEIIKKADDYISRVDQKFSAIKEPLNTAVKSLNALIKELKEPAEITKVNLRKRCLEWKIAEEKRLATEMARRLEEARKDWTPLDGEPPAQISMPTPSTSPSSTRKSPWKARITSLDQLWEAAIRDPRYREYFIPDEKALNAKARSMGAMMNIPGVEPYQEQTLVIR